MLFVVKIYGICWTFSNLNTAYLTESIIRQTININNELRRTPANSLNGFVETNEINESFIT